MSGKRKHPLEVFKASGRSLGGQPSGDDASAEARTEDGRERLGLPRKNPARQNPARQNPARQNPARQNPARQAATEPVSRPPSEFELRLNLPGALVLLFAWVVLMGAAYIYGHSRGRGGMLQERDQTALALGRDIEEASSSANPQAREESTNTPARPRPYGVLLVTYNSYQEERIQEISKLLREKYGIAAGIFPWTRSNGQVEVFVGEFDKVDDPALRKLAANVRNIQDWPSGGDKTPFEESYVRRHPGIPDEAARANR